MRRRDFIAMVGVSAAWKSSARAQKLAKAHRIAIVAASESVSELTEGGGNPHYEAFLQELRQLGDVEGQNLVIERYSGEGRTEHYDELVSEVVSRNPDLIFATTSLLVRRFKKATSTIPIVGFTADPVAYGIVATLARPGGNVTMPSTPRISFGTPPTKSTGFCGARSRAKFLITNRALLS
jgi:putative ABC transport system substrate-binding protein